MRGCAGFLQGAQRDGRSRIEVNRMKFIVEIPDTPITKTAIKSLIKNSIIRASLRASIDNPIYSVFLNENVNVTEFEPEKKRLIKHEK